MRAAFVVSGSDKRREIDKLACGAGVRIWMRLIAGAALFAFASENLGWCCCRFRGAGTGPCSMGRENAGKARSKGASPGTRSIKRIGSLSCAFLAKMRIELR